MKKRKIKESRLTLYKEDYPKTINLETGDLILYKRRGFLGWLISLFTGSKFSHVSLYYESRGINRRPMVTEAVGNRGDNSVRNISFDNSIYEREWTYLKLRGDLLKKKEFLNDLSKLSKLKYDYKNFIRIAFNKNLEEDTSKVFCSEYVAFLYEKYHTLIDVNSQMVVPGDYLRNKRLLDLFDVRKLVG